MTTSRITQTNLELRDAAEEVFNQIHRAGMRPSAEHWTLYGTDTAKLVCDAIRFQLLISGENPNISDEMAAQAYITVRKAR